MNASLSDMRILMTAYERYIVAVSLYTCAGEDPGSNEVRNFAEPTQANFGVAVSR